MVGISVNDMLVKGLSGDYPLHQIVFIRSLIGILVSFAILRVEGGLAALRTDAPGLHALRGLLIVAANMSFFAALATLPLADTTALFFLAPLFITLLSIPALGERVGPRRMSAVLAGFAGMLVMLRPWEDANADSPPLAVLLLPVIAAFCYASTQVLTRRLGVSSPASAMAIYIHTAFLLVGAAFWLFAGDGRHVEGLESESLVFLLRAWVWPGGGDWVVMIGLGLISGLIGYGLSQAYRIADASTVAPFEYVTLPLAIFWGWLAFGELPSGTVVAGSALIVGAGLYVFMRERRQ